MWGAHRTGQNPALELPERRDEADALLGQRPGDRRPQGRLAGRRIDGSILETPIDLKKELGGFCRCRLELAGQAIAS